MDTGVPPELTTDPADPPVARLTLAQLFRKLIVDSEAFIRAEVQLYRAQAVRKAVSAGLAAGLIAGAILLAQAVVVALLIGILLAIAPAVGMVWATVIVTLTGIVVVGLLFALGASRISRLINPEDES